MPVTNVFLANKENATLLFDKFLILFFFSLFLAATEVGATNHLEEEKKKTDIEHGVVSKSFSTGIAPLEIVTPSSKNFYVMLVDANTDETVLSGFIVNGTRFYTKMPLGDYKLKYAVGHDWFGKKYHFGPETQYYVGDKIFQFTSNGRVVSGYTVELILQVNGNLRTNQISRCQFDQTLCN